MTASTKQTPPAGAELPRGMRVADMCEMQHAGIPLNLGKYLAHLTTAQLASLGLRRVAEEAGPVEREPCEVCGSTHPIDHYYHPDCDRCEGEGKLNPNGRSRPCPDCGGSGKQLAAPAQGGEAPGGGEEERSILDQGERVYTEPDPQDKLVPPPTAAPERDAGEKCTFCRGEGSHYNSMTGLDVHCAACLGKGKTPAAPTPEPVKLPDLPTERELREWRSLRMLAHPGPESVRVMARIAFPTLLDAHDALRARVAELERSLAAFQGREVRFSKLLEGRPKSAASLESRIVEYVVELQAERDELRNDLEHRTQSLSDLYRIHIPREIELKKHAENAESQCAAAEVAARAAIAGAAESARLYESWRSEGVSQRKRAEAAEAKLEAARALIERSHLHPEVRRALLAALASDSPTTGKDGR